MKCFPDLYHYGVNGQHEERLVRLTDHEFIKSKLMSKHSQFRLPVSQNEPSSYQENVPPVTSLRRRTRSFLPSPFGYAFSLIYSVRILHTAKSNVKVHTNKRYFKFTYCKFERVKSLGITSLYIINGKKM